MNRKIEMIEAGSSRNFLYFTIRVINRLHTYNGIYDIISVHIVKIRENMWEHPFLRYVWVWV